MTVPHMCVVPFVRAFFEIEAHSTPGHMRQQSASHTTANQLINAKKKLSQYEWRGIGVIVCRGVEWIRVAGEWRANGPACVCVCLISVFNINC